MPDLETIIKTISALFQLFGQIVPSWFWILLGILFIIYLLLRSISFLLSFANTVKSEWTQLRDPEQRSRRIRRQTFAEHIEHEIRQLSRREDWKDKRFTELEAEVEAEGSRKIFSPIPFFNPVTSGLRHEKSLSKALAWSRERYILVEGEPGSGKSVALRHVAHVMAQRAEKSRNIESIIPIYVNLKELDRPDKTPIDRNLIKKFILDSLKRANDRDIDQFVDEEFHEGVTKGTWFFIFDSFDELPEILSSTEVDQVIKSYGDAIDTFLHGMNRCHGVVASRQFRGPTYLTWPRFRILPLAEKRRLQLIHKSDMTVKLANDLVGWLGNASEEIHSMASNPLFLTLLCEHIKSGQPFPENTHIVFETYIENRLKRDRVRLEKRFTLDTHQIRTFAEQVAFCMSADSGLGLSPARNSLQQAMIHLNMDVPSNFTSLLDALEFIKLARSEGTISNSLVMSFTFAHRRFQEYFATCVVLRETRRVTSEELLTNARWRETAVVMCQTQTASELTLIIEQAQRLLEQFSYNIPDLVTDSLEYVQNKGKKTVKKYSATRNKLSLLVRLLDWLELLRMEKQSSLREGFLWPAGLNYLLSLLQDGFSSRITEVPDAVRELIARFVLSATEKRPLDDRKRALEVAGLAPESVLSYLLSEAFNGDSQWLKEVAYRQVARLNTIPSAIAKGICKAIIQLEYAGRLRRERHATEAHLSRLPRMVSTNFLTIVRLMLLLPILDFEWHLILYIFFITIYAYIVPNSYISHSVNLAVFTLLFLISYLGSWRIISRHQWKIGTRLVFFLLSRFLLFSSAALILAENTRFDQWNSGELLFYIYVGISSYIVFFLLTPFDIAETGFLVSWIPWAIIPWWPIFWGLFYLYKKLSSLMTLLLKKDFYISLVRGTLKLLLIGLFGIFGFLLFILLVSIFAIFASYIWTILNADINLQPVINVFSDVFSEKTNLLYISIIFIPLIILTSLLYLIPPISSWIQWRRLLKDQRGRRSLTYQQLWDMVEDYSSYDIWSKARLIRSIRTMRILSATEETEVHLKSLALQIEANIVSKKHQVMLDSLISLLHDWKKGEKKNDKHKRFVSDADAETLDELYLLLEDIQNFRKH